MDLIGELDALRREIDQLANECGTELEARYALQRPRKPPGVYWQIRWLAGKVLRTLRSLVRKEADAWPAALKHSGRDRSSKPVVVWALGFNPEQLRQACAGIDGLLRDLPGVAPVLVTDIADFAHYSRICWLVEYVPDIRGTGSFALRKSQYLARLYKDAPVLPAGYGLCQTAERSVLRAWLAENV